MAATDIPSVHLQITKEDAERFLDASEAFRSASLPLDGSKPLHVAAYEAARSGSHPYMSSFLDRLKAMSLPQIEIQTAPLLLLDMDRSAKLKAFYDAFGPSNVRGMFRAILGALTACTHSDPVLVEGKPGSPQRSSSKQDKQEFRSSQSPSFDSSLATLRDEDDFSRREMDEVANFAANDVVSFASNQKVTAETVEQWYQGKKTAVPWLELLHLSEWKRHAENQSSPGLAMEDASPTLISFDFSGPHCPSALCITITEENLVALRRMVMRTSLEQRPAVDMCKSLLGIAKRRTVKGETLFTLTRDEFVKAIPNVISMDELPTAEREAFTQSLSGFFAIYEGAGGGMADYEVNLKELAVGICFFCAGNKSSKLATGFELLDEKQLGYLTEDQLVDYLRSYLLALVAISFLKPLNRQNREAILPSQRESIRLAVDSGAKWSLGHFLSYLGPSDPSIQKNQFTFEGFAHWYSTGGYNTAPWLELLDLQKVFSLIHCPTSPIVDLPPFKQAGFQTTERRPPKRDRMSSLRRHHSVRRGPPPEVLYTFPLAGNRFLVVLKDDALYVREVVEKMGLVSATPEELWESLSKAVSKRRKPSKEDDVAVYVNSNTFVQAMLDASPKASRKRSSPGKSPSSSELSETFSNFFQCFDFDQVDSVALDELMGGLALLCGGKKSMKLAFAFSIFDTRPGVLKTSKQSDFVHSLSGEDLFLFLRSILIVTFSCCRQSLDLADDVVSRCIADTANMICNDVMAHQWATKRLDRLNFDEFGQWYNDGGYERAPWLELLDLHKWVLVEDFEKVEMQGQDRQALAARMAPPASEAPPAPEDSALDPSFFDEHGLLPMDSMDEMDMMLMPQPSVDRDMDGDSGRLMRSFSFSPRTKAPERSPSPQKQTPLKFQLVTDDGHGGYMLSISRVRIDHFRRILEESGIHRVNVEEACNAVLAKSTRQTKTDGEPRLVKDGFDKALQSIASWSRTSSSDSRTVLAGLLDDLFTAFDKKNTGRPSVIEVACGLTVLCQGKKSDKLEFAFEVLDKNKRGHLSKKDMVKYLQAFLTVLLNVAFSPSLRNDKVFDSVSTLDGVVCERSGATLNRAVKAGAEWAANQIFRDSERSRNNSVPTMTFDDFGSWYTEKGFSSIPWLELIDLRKWVMISA